MRGAFSFFPSPIPTSFTRGRYQVKKFLGEGGKKKVYLVHDSLLDRDVAFALIKNREAGNRFQSARQPGSPDHW
jgi:hypothetical protein